MKENDTNAAQFICYDLRTGETEPLWSTNRWESIYSFIQDGKFIVFDQRFNGEFIESNFSIFDLTTGQLVGHFVTDFRSINW